MVNRLILWSIFVVKLTTETVSVVNVSVVNVDHKSHFVVICGQLWSIVVNWIGEAGYNAYFVVNIDEAEGVQTAFVVNKATGGSRSIALAWL